MSKRVLRGFIGTDYSLRLITQVKNKAGYYFEDKKELALFDVLYNYALTFSNYPTFDYLDGRFELEKGNDAMDVYASVKAEKPYANEGEFRAFLEIELRRHAGSRIVQKLRDGANKLAVASLDEVQKEADQVYVEVGTCLRDMKSKDEKSILCWGPEAIESTRKHYDDVKLKGCGNLAQYGFDFIDSVTGGIQKDDFITVAAFSSHGKSAMIRRFAHKFMLQGLNVYFETLEMKQETIMNHFLVMHANDLKIWGSARPKISSSAVKNGTLTAKEESFFKDEVIPDFMGNENYGTMYIQQPGTANWTFDDAKAAVKEYCREKMPVEVYICDYLTLFVPTNSRGRIEANDYNRMIEDARQFTLDEGIAMMTPHQCNRRSYEAMAKDKNHLYTLDCLSDYHAMERSSTVVISLAQPDDLKNAGLIQVQSLKHREGALFPTTRLTVDYSLGQYYEAGVGALSDEESILGLLEMGI